MHAVNTGVLRAESTWQSFKKRQFPMSLETLTEKERVIIRKALEATFDYLTHGFHARLGVSEEEMKQLIDQWPNVDDSSDKSLACLAINNALNDLLNGVGISNAEAIEKIGANREELQSIYPKWDR